MKQLNRIPAERNSDRIKEPRKSYCMKSLEDARKKQNVFIDEVEEEQFEDSRRIQPFLLQKVKI